LFKIVPSWDKRNGVRGDCVENDGTLVELLSYTELFNDFQLNLLTAVQDVILRLQPKACQWRTRAYQLSD
jgi:hypothetical protein